MTVVVIPITSLPEATVVNGSDLLVISQGGVTKKVTKDNLAIGVVSGNNITSVTHSNKSADFTQALGTGARLMFIDCHRGSNPLVFKAGTTAGGEEIIEETTVSGADSFNVMKWYSAAATVYITIVSGDGDFIIGYYNNWHI
jgi:hypothetical protein